MKYTDYYTFLKEDIRSQSDDYYYHVTLAPYVNNILTHGLKINKKTTVSNYKFHSQGKIFLCDIGSVDWWRHTIEQHAIDQFDDERYHDTAVLKIKKDKLSNVQVDKIGSDDSRGNSYFVTYDIAPQYIELYI